MHNQVRVVGPLEAVFDLVTSARLWPEWHPASRAVAGVTERPYRLGDIIYEHVAIGTKILDFRWRVTEHIRPSRVVLQAENRHARITYSFKGDGPVVLFTRVLEYEPEDERDAPRVALPRESRARQTQPCLVRLKELVETILAAEACGLS